MAERTAEDYVNDMLAHGRDWIAILAVSRFVRGGKWYEECQKILIDSGKMPSDPETMLKDRKAYLARKPVEDRPKYFTGHKH